MKYNILFMPNWNGGEPKIQIYPYAVSSGSHKISPQVFEQICKKYTVVITAPFAIRTGYFWFAVYNNF